MTKFNEDYAPWLRLLTPILMVMAMFILNGMSKDIGIMAAEIKDIGAEQARRTVIVEDSYSHNKDWSIHKRHNP